MTDAPNFLDIEPEFSDADRAAIAVLPVPYDATSSWVKGADEGPDALLRASAHVEWFDLETRTEVHRRGVATLPPVTCDAQTPPEIVADRVRETVGRLFDRGVFPVVLGGEHSVSIGAIQAAADRFDDLCVLQIDAHGDTRETYLGSAYNHACVMARARERCPIMQVGIRSAERDEVERMDPERVFFAHDIHARERAGDFAWIDDAVGRLSPSVYVTFDLDAFDPSLLPATGTPEPGGLTWRQANDLLSRVARERRVVGFDVVELCPRDGHHASDFTAAKLVHRFVSAVFAAR